MDNDVLQKAICENGEAVVYVLNATALVQESMERVAAWPPAAKHLGQAMMASLLLQALSDSDVNDSISLQWTCEGPFGHLFAEAKNFGEVRGTIARPQAPVADYTTGLGHGLLQVRRSLNRVGTTSIVNSTGVVSSDIVEYLEKSEQKNCGINLSVVVDWEDEARTKFRIRSAIAYLLHVMPQPTEAKLNEALLRWNRQMEALDMLRLLLGEENPKLVMTQRVAFKCNCDVNRAARALALLEAQEEKEGTFQKAPETEIRCEYCGKAYMISSAAADTFKGFATPKPSKEKSKKNLSSKSPQRKNPKEPLSKPSRSRKKQNQKPKRKTKKNLKLNARHIAKAKSKKKKRSL
jgi:redox-regulated HSP33 family molecular chaperone